MSSVLYVAYMLVSFVTNVFGFLMSGSLLQFRCNRKKYMIIMMLSAFIMAAAVYVFEEAVLYFHGLLPGILINELARLILTTVVCLSCFDNKASSKLSISFLVVVSQLFSKLIYYALLLFTVKANVDHIFIDNIEYRILFLLITDFSYLLLLYSVAEIRKNRNISAVLFSCGVYVMLLFLLGTASQEHIYDWNLHYLLGMAILIMTVTVAILLLSDKARKNAVLRAENLRIQTEQEMYKKQVNDANRYIEEIAKIKHDMKNKLYCISELVVDNNTAEVLRICNETETELAHTSQLFNTSNPYLNSVLNVICKKAKENNVDAKVVVKTDLKYIDGTDMITLLGNLCDNAIEAVNAESDNREFVVSLFEKGDNYIISVKNYIVSSVLTGNESLKTSKPDTLYHGYGLKTVRSIVKKYDGILDISEEDHLFMVNIMIKIPSTTK